MLAGAAWGQAQDPKLAEKSTFDGDFGIALVNKDGKNRGTNEETTTIAIRYYSKDDKPSRITDVQLTVHYVFDIVGTKSTTGLETRKLKVIPKWDSGDLITLAITPVDVLGAWITVEGTSGKEKFKFEMLRPGQPEGKPSDLPGAIRYDFVLHPTVANTKDPYTIRLWYELDAGVSGPLSMVEGEVTVYLVRGEPKKIPFRARDWQPGRAGGRDFSFREQPRPGAPILMDAKAALDGKPVELHFSLRTKDLFPSRIPEGTELIPRDFRATVSEAGGDADLNYPLPQDQKTSEARIAGVIRKWEDTLKLGFEKGPGAKEPWAGKMRRAIESYATMQICRGEASINPRRRAFARALTTAVAAGAEDPLIRYWILLYLGDTGAARSKYTSPEGIDTDPESYVELLKVFSKSSYPPLMKIYMAQSLVTRSRELQRFIPNKGAPGYLQPLGEVIKAADAFWWEQITALARIEEPEELDAIVDMMKTSFMTLDRPNEEAAAEMLRRLAEAKAPKWLLLFLEGDFMTYLAGQAREGKLYRERIEIARERLEASAKLEPKRSYAFGGMISVCTSLGLEREEMEKWFRKAMVINPDEWNACIRKLKYLHPRSHGTLDDYFDFLDQCIRTKNWRAGLPQLADHELPDLFRYAPHRFEFDQGHPAIFCRIKAGFEVVMEAEPKNTAPIATYVMACFTGDRWQEALDALAKLDDGEFRPNPFRPSLDLAKYRAYCRNRLPVK
jgi:hypothetical protein